MNWTVFKTRTITALVFVMIILGGVLWNELSFFILFSIIHWGCWIEYEGLIKRIDPSYKGISYFHAYGVIIAGWALMLYGAGNNYPLEGSGLHAIGLAVGLVFAFALPVIEILFSKQFNLKHISYSALGILYISVSWTLMINIRSIEGLWISGTGQTFEIGWIIPLIIIFSIWINDTMAYITGSLIGKTPFSKVSPKKTIEGTIGGAVLCVAVMGGIAYAMQLHVLQICIIAGISAVMGTAGDLLESKLKRMADVKDSGHIMPGHGGFLDRFDSMLLATPFVWVYMMAVLK